MPNFAVILAAAGRSSRFKDQHYKKPFANLKKKAVWLHSAELFLKRSDVKQLIMVIAEDDRESFTTKFGANMAVMGIDLTIGGAERADSVRNGLEQLRDDIDFVAVHDAARPCIINDDIDNVFAAAEKSGAAILATPVNATLKRSTSKEEVEETVDRANLWQALTPQVFKRDLLTDAYAKLGSTKPTDEAQAVELAGHTVSLVEGSPLNIKITSKADLRLATACLNARPTVKFDAPLGNLADDSFWA